MTRPPLAPDAIHCATSAAVWVGPARNPVRLIGTCRQRPCQRLQPGDKWWTMDFSL